ncbi:MAG: hypothetical protein H6825_11060, partial [Planctomycetes bacterium]|nr:hypothetical protein [Planctomycetota bacterium]
MPTRRRIEGGAERWLRVCVVAAASLVLVGVVAYLAEFGRLAAGSDRERPALDVDDAASVAAPAMDLALDAPRAVPEPLVLAAPDGETSDAAARDDAASWSHPDATRALVVSTVLGASDVPLPGVRVEVLDAQKRVVSRAT